MTDRLATRLARMAFGVICLLFLAGLATTVLNRSAQAAHVSASSTNVGRFFFLVAIFAFPAAGALITFRQPRNRIGWVMLAVGLIWGLSGFLEGYILYGLVTRPGSLSRPDLVLALYAWLWVPGVGLVGTFLILLFPDGRLPSPRWRPLAWLCAFTLTIVSIVAAISPGTFVDAGYPDIANPLAVEAPEPLLGTLYAVPMLIPLCVLGCAASLVRRFRRAGGQERLQLKWLAASAAAITPLFLVTMAVSLPGVGGVRVPAWVFLLQEISIFSLALIPLAAGIAIRKYRLYDIDRIINRALVYGALTAVLTAGYFAMVAVLQSLSRPLVGESELAVAGSTLLMAVLFQPARRGIQTFIDRRFYRQKYDTAQTLGAFATRLRNEVGLDALTTELPAVTSQVMQTANVSLWLRDPSPNRIGQPRR